MDATLTDVLRELKRGCSVPENIHLDHVMVTYGASAQGVIEAAKFQSALVAAFPRIHWTEEKFLPLLQAYGCGYQSPIRYQTLGDSAGTQAPTAIAWKDFCRDVAHASMDGELLNGSPSNNRKQVEQRFNSRYGSAVHNPADFVDDFVPDDVWDRGMRQS